MMIVFNLENNYGLYGKIPNIDYKYNVNISIECSFSNTHLCYSNKYSYCKYPNYECSACKDNAKVVNNVCQCNNGYNGIGYIKCFTGDYRECKYINSLIGMEESYNCCFDDDILCSDDHIKELDLSDKGLSGNFPESIYKLTGLEWLKLSKNSLSGSISDSIKNLNKITYL
ncbi:hypothetical protein PIROE2DRAFT_12731 [Piromyces sp. E2]|nr:hypothetical protein PIROE2DRAFT_12731 [Piromyces sp. E2]|eukprot:OUM61310.1 hypothetical protein PIROE2DRAFT_12731 [Piromyces sp. E2]